VLRLFASKRWERCLEEFMEYSSTGTAMPDECIVDNYGFAERIVKLRKNKVGFWVNMDPEEYDKALQENHFTPTSPLQQQNSRD
jgi:hypothetical protein